jgi:GT2 family glycosyltransferase
MPEAGELSVVVVNWSARDQLLRCLRSLEAQSDRDFETIVVDNGSTDDSVALVRADFPWVKLVEAGANLGFAEGSNRGIEASSGKWVVTLNNDARAEQHFIRELKKATQAGGEDLGMVQACLLFDEPPYRTNSTGVLMSRDGRFVDRDFDRAREESARAGEVFCVCAGAAMYRRRMLDEVRLSSGFFDRNYFMYLEDVDLGWRCRLAGWQALYWPAARVFHTFHGTSDRHGRHFAALHCYRNRVRTLAKNASVPGLARSLPRSLLELAYTVVQGGPSAVPAFLAALIGGAQQRGEVSRLAPKGQREAVEQRWMTSLRTFRK